MTLSHGQNSQLVGQPSREPAGFNCATPNEDVRGRLHRRRQLSKGFDVEVAGVRAQRQQTGLFHNGVSFVGTRLGSLAQACAEHIWVCRWGLVPSRDPAA